MKSGMKTWNIENISSISMTDFSAISYPWNKFSHNKIENWEEYMIYDGEIRAINAQNN